VAVAPALNRRAPAAYAGWIGLLIVIYYAFPAARVEAWGLLCLSGVGTIIAGVRLHRPARKAPWLLLAVALTSFAAGQLSFLVAKQVHAVLPFPSFADAFYLACYPLYAAGMLGFIAARSPHGDRRALIDGLTLTAGLALLSWTFLIRPYVHDPSLTGLQKAVAVAYPLGDVLVLALLARLLAPGTGGARSVRLLALGAVGVLAADASYGAIQLHGLFSNGGPTDLGWALFYSAWGAAALQPDMGSLTEPVPRQQATVSPARLGILMLAALIAPVMLLTTRPGGPATDVSVIAVFSAILYLLVLTRLWDAAASNRRALARERVLRQAGLSLEAADGLPEAADAVRSAAAALLGGRSRGDAVLGVRSAGEDAIRAVPGTRPPRDQGVGRLAEAWLPLVAGAGPVLVSTRDLPERARTVRPGAGWMLLCPLAQSDPGAGEPVGLIAVFGEQRALADLTATLEILAHQVALTVERSLLRQEVIRQRNEAYFRTLVQDASDAILIVRDDGTVAYATPSAAAIFGADVQVAGSRFGDLVAGGDSSGLAGTFRRLRDQPGADARTLNQRITRHDGLSVHLQARCSDLRTDPSVAGLVFTLRDVTEQHELEKQLTYRAFHDALTGLPNRVLLQDRIARELAAAGRAGTVAGVLFIDLDDFKLVNDSLGHAAGDDLLVAVAARLAALIRDADTAARLGGDEFAVLVGAAADDSAVEAAAARVVGAFAEPFLLPDGPVTTSVTVGVATTDDSADTSELLRHADLALYAAKAAGKRQWRRYEAVYSAGLARRREIKDALEETAGRAAFALAYQPIVRLATGRLAGFEALLRWPHPDWGMLLPGQFVSLAEETGQIVPIGAWVLGQATADITSWGALSRPGAAGPLEAGLYVSVNVSARQFADPGFSGTVRRVLDDSGLDPARLVLELTETALMPSDGGMIADLAAMRSIGIRLAIDDFGTGYSSLAYLRELPVDIVKMDKSFVEGMEGGGRPLALAAGIVHLASTLGFEVVAEGIETEAQRELLTDMGCHYGQGYLLARPMPPGPAADLARARSAPAAPDLWDTP
jgi:diguanylate cyclase (GGDEF)-like protein/PAS domain S-box-containing protein